MTTEQDELYAALVRLCQASGTTTGDTYDHLHRAVDSLEWDDDDDITVCRWCGEEIGIIHYGNQDSDDRWQPTPALGDDFCESRWDESPGEHLTEAQESAARESSEFRHEPYDD